MTDIMEPITASKARVLLTQVQNQLRSDLIKELNEVVSKAVNKNENYAYINIKYYNQIDYIKSLGYTVERIPTGPNEEDIKISW